MISGHPLIFALICVVVIWAIANLICRKLRFLAIVTGADGRPSTSKLQFFVWNGVVIFAYLAMWAARGQIAGATTQPNTNPDFPSNVLLAMGFSAGTLALAKGITVNQAGNNTIVKNILPAPIQDVSAFFEDDNGDFDLGKFQMLVWIGIAVAVYLHRVIHEIYLGHAGQFSTIPDIDTALMTLMGLGQGAYLGKKAVGPDTPPPAAGGGAGH